MKQYYVVAAWLEQRRIKYKLNDGSLRWGPDATSVSGFGPTSITYIAQGYIQMIEINTATGGFGSNKFLGRANQTPSAGNNSSPSKVQDVETVDSSYHEPRTSNSGSLFLWWIKTVLRFLWKPQTADVGTAIVGMVSIAIIGGIGFLGLQGYDSVRNFIGSFTDSSSTSKSSSGSERKATITQDKVLEMIGGYVNTMTDAINSGNFRKVSNYMDSDSAAYEKQIKQAEKLFHSGVTKEILEITISNIAISQTVAKVNVYEKYKIIYGERGYKYSDNFYVYHLQKQRPYKIIDILSGKNIYNNSGNKAVITQDTQLCTYPSWQPKTIATVKRNDSVRIYPNETLTENGESWVKVKHAEYGLGWVTMNSIKTGQGQGSAPSQTKQPKPSKQSQNQVKQSVTSKQDVRQSASSASAVTSKPPANEDERRYQELLERYNLVPSTDGSNSAATETNTTNDKSGSAVKEQPKTEIVRKKGTLSGVRSLGVYAYPKNGATYIGTISDGESFTVYPDDVYVDSQGTSWIRIEHSSFGTGWVYANYIKVSR